MMKELNAIFAIAARDFSKFLHDRFRILATFVFPFVFIGVLGGSLQSNLGEKAGFNFMTFVFVGVIAQVLFQSTASGIISLVNDRETDFSREIFVSPISRYSIIIGKILGESLVALAQGVGIIAFGLLIRVPIDFSRLAGLLPLAFVVCLYGGAFGILIMANLTNQRFANQFFPFLMFPQFFLSGVFSPITSLPPGLSLLSHIAPMTYAVDLLRSVYYAGTKEYSLIVLAPFYINLAVMGVLFAIFIVIGTTLFVRGERNR